jgi:hypothetical protein
MFRTFPAWFTALARQRDPKMPPPEPVDMADLTKTLNPS